MSDPIPDVAPEDEEGKAIWSIRRVAKALGQNISEEQGRVLFNTAKSRVTEAMAAGNVNQPPSDHSSGG